MQHRIEQAAILNNKSYTARIFEHLIYKYDQISDEEYLTLLNTASEQGVNLAFVLKSEDMERQRERAISMGFVYCFDCGSKIEDTITYLERDNKLVEFDKVCALWAK